MSRKRKNNIDSVGRSSGKTIPSNISEPVTRHQLENNNSLDHGNIAKEAHNANENSSSNEIDSSDDEIILHEINPSHTAPMSEGPDSGPDTENSISNATPPPTEEEILAKIRADPNRSATLQDRMNCHNGLLNRYYIDALPHNVKDEDIKDIIPDREFGRGARILMEEAKDGEYIYDSKDGVFIHEDTGETLGLTTWDEETGEAKPEEEELWAVEPVQKVGVEFEFEGKRVEKLDKLRKDARARRKAARQAIKDGQRKKEAEIVSSDARENLGDGDGSRRFPY